jgi:dihydrofolate reductase
VKLALIVAASENGVIGRENALPWHLPEDLRHFRRLTMGKPIIMGRRTFESIGRPLPGRTNIVITRNTRLDAPGVRVVSTLEEALDLGSSIARADEMTEMLVIGGAEIYRAALPRAHRLYLTEVHAQVTGDVKLPPVDWTQWRECSRERHGSGGSNPYDYSFVVFDRIIA